MGWLGLNTAGLVTPLRGPTSQTEHCTLEPGNSSLSLTPLGEDDVIPVSVFVGLDEDKLLGLGLGCKGLAWEALASPHFQADILCCHSNASNDCSLVNNGVAQLFALEDSSNVFGFNVLVSAE